MCNPATVVQVVKWDSYETVCLHMHPLLEFYIVSGDDDLSEFVICRLETIIYKHAESAAENKPTVDPKAKGSPSK